MNAKIEISRDAIAAFCQRNHIRRMAFFGSVLRDDFGPESDVDVLVEFEPGTSIGYMGLMRLEIELGEVLGRKTDLHTFKGVEENPNWLIPGRQLELSPQKRPASIGGHMQTKLSIPSTQVPPF